MQSTFALAAQHNEGIRPYLNRVADDLNPLRVQALFEAIPDEDVGVSASIKSWAGEQLYVIGIEAS
jgi:hypothetical protein